MGSTNCPNGQSVSSEVQVGDTNTDDPVAGSESKAEMPLNAIYLLVLDINYQPCIVNK